jgi:hypothetical protein
MRRIAGDPLFRRAWLSIWFVRVFFTVMAIGAIFLLWVGSPSVVHGQVVATATGWRWTLVKIGYCLVLVVMLLSWVARPLRVDDDSME